MDWTVRPRHATNLQARNVQVQGLYQLQQPASGFFQASTSAQNSSAYTGNDQAIKTHPRTGNMLPNQLSSQNNVGSNNFQPPLLKSSVPVPSGFGTTQHFVGQCPSVQFSSMTVQMTSGPAKNTWPNSNVHIFLPAAPQLSTANAVQRPPNQYTALDMNSNWPQKKGSNSVQGPVFWGNINNSGSERLPMKVLNYRPANPQTHATVPLNQVSSHFLNSEQNSSCLTYPSGQKIQNQINDVNSGSATAMQSQQDASNYVHSSPYTIPTHYAAQIIPQATNTKLPRPPPPQYPVPPIQINNGQFIQPQPVLNTFNENVQNPRKLELDQNNVSYSVQQVQTPETVPVFRETSEVGGAADSIPGHSAENQSSDKLTKLNVEALKSIPGTVPLDKTSTPQTTRSMVEDNKAKSSGNGPDSVIKMREKLKLELEEILVMKKKLEKMAGQFKLKHRLYKSVVQKSNTSDPSVRNPDRLPPTSNTHQQPALPPQATHQIFSLTSHNATQNPTSLLTHDNAQNRSPSLLPLSSSQIQDGSLMALKQKNYLYPILRDLLKGTTDEEMLLNQSKQLFFQEKCFSGSVLDSSGARSETSVSDTERSSRLSPETSQNVSTQGSLTSRDLCTVQELTNMAARSGRDLFNGFVLNEDKVVVKLLTNPQSLVSVQNPAESSQPRKKLAKEGSKDPQNSGSEFILQSKDRCLQTSDKSVTTQINGNDVSSSASLAATVPEAGIVQRSSFTGNSCAVGRSCSLEELETSLALWRKSPAASLNDQLDKSTKSTMGSSPLVVEENKEMEYTTKNFPNGLTHYEKCSITVGKNEPTLSSVSSYLGQKVDAVGSSSSKSSEPQVAIVPPLILYKEGIWNEAQENNLTSMMEKYPVIAEGSVCSLHEFAHTFSDTDKPVKRSVCSPSDSCVTEKEVDSDLYQETAKSTEENGIKREDSRTACSCDPNQGLTDPLELEKSTLQLYSRDSFPPGTNKDSSSPVFEKCVLKTSPDLVEPEDTVLNDNMLQISSVCTLVQGDAYYNSQIANIFNSSSKTEHNSSSEDQRPDSYHKERQLSHRKRESEINGSTSVGDALSPSIDTVSKAIAEKLLSLPGLKIPQGGKISNEVNVRELEEETNTELDNPNSGKDPEQNVSCGDVLSTDMSSCTQEVPGNSIANEDSTHGIQDNAPVDENQVHSVNNTDITLTLPNDQLTELLKEFPYGIDDSKALKKTENEDCAAKVNEIKEGQETQTSGQNSEANHALDQIRITILNPQQMKELFPEHRSQSSKKLENRENDKLTIASENTNKSHIRTMLVESTNTSSETVQTPASHSFCCTKAWLGLRYVVDPCEHMLAKEAALKQQLDQYLPSEIIIKEEAEINVTSSTDCRLNNQQQTRYPISHNLPSEAESNSILRESELQGNGHKPLKEDKGLTPYPFLDKLEPLTLKNKEPVIEELPEKVQIDEHCNQKCTTLGSRSHEQLYSGTDDSKGESTRSPSKRDLSGKERTPKETVVDKSKSHSLRHRSMENKYSKKREKYKIKRDSSETHIIKGPSCTFKRRLKKHIASERKQKTKKRKRKKDLLQTLQTATNPSHLSNVDLVSTAYNNVQHSQEHLNGQKHEIERNLEANKAMRTEQSESSSSEPIEQNKGNFARTNLKKFAYPEERGYVWKYRRSLSDSTKTSKVQTLNTYKANSSSKEVVRGAHKRDRYSAKTLSDKKSPCHRKNNTLTLQREQKKHYLNKVAFKQTEQSICLTKLEQSPSKALWHVKPSSASEHPEDKKNYIPPSQQSETAKPRMLEFKMCPETVFRNLVSEDVPDAKKLPEKERIPVSAVKSRREDWLNYTPQKRRKIDEKETQVDDRIPLETAMELLDKNEAIKNSNATFETYRKMHLKKSRSLDSSPVN